MKKMRLIGIFLVCLFTWEVVHAQQAFTCDNTIYTMGAVEGTEMKTIYPLYYKGDGNPTGYRLAIYGAYPAALTTISYNDFYGLAYCIAPSKHGVTYGAPLSSEYKCVRKIDPTTNNPYDMAIAVLYQKLLDRGYPGGPGSDIKYVAYIINRWLAYDYNMADTTGVPEIANPDFNVNEVWSNPNSNVWVKSDHLWTQAYDLYNEVVSTVSKYKTYDEMVANKVVWSPSWTYEVLSKSSGSVQLRVSLSENVNQVYWNEFSVSCQGKYSCRIASITDQTNNSAIFNIAVTGDSSSTSVSELNMEVLTSYYDIKSPSANAFIFATVDDINKYGQNFSQYNWQKYMFMLNWNEGNKERGGSRLKIGKGSCAKPHENGNDTDNWICTDKDGDGVGENCATRNPQNPEAQFKLECAIDTGVCNKDSLDSNEWLCADQNGDGVGERCVTRNPSNPGAQWLAECGKTPCSTSNGKYYCDDVNGDGSADECDAKDYTKKCECPQWENDCDADPTNKTACDNYEDKCVTCVPTVTIPSDCSTLQDYGQDIYNSNYNAGKISDITKKATSCNSNRANTPKSCVIGKEDASEQSYENKTISSVQNNPYCKVWCEEEYSFSLPTAKRTVSGGYFTLTASVTGTRTCYTSAADDYHDPIDNDLFQSDLEKKRREIIDAWNEYSRWKVGASQPDQTRTITDSDDGCISGHWEDGPDNNGDGSPDSQSYVCDEQCNESGEWTQYYYEWDYPTYNYSSSPGPNTTHQSEITDGGGSCWTCGCTGESGNGSSQLAVFANKRDAALNTLNTKVQEFKNIIAQFNDCSGLIRGNAPNSGWNNDMQFGPEITFSYNEGYLGTNDVMGKFEGQGERSSSSATYCDGETDRDYKCSGTTATSSGTEVPGSVRETIWPIICKESGCDASTPFDISKADWVKKVKTVSEDFSPSTSFSTYTQYGTIRKNAQGQYELYTALPSNAYPISMIQETGVFPFTITLDNIGQSNEDGTLGRLIGLNYQRSTGKNDILTSYNKMSQAEKCDINGRPSSRFEEAKTSSGYVCHYVNNCDDCEFDCNNGNCSFERNCTDCSFNCDTCIFDGNRVTYNYRTISLNRIFPNARTMGYNWSNSLKGAATIQAISNSDVPENIYRTPQYSFTLTPDSMSQIRLYNDAAGSYTNAVIPSNYVNRVSGGSDAAVYCDQVTYGGKNYSVRCRSRFLDLVESMENTRNPLAKNVYRITSTKEEDDNAWELFTETNSCRNGSCLRNGIGPSWRLRNV